MRVLCLHPSTSSATQLHSALSTLEERLWTKHGIELVFVDAPLLDVTVGNELGEQNGGLTALHFNNGGDGEEEAMVSSRRWYVEEQQYVDDGKKRLSSSPASDATTTTTVKYSGLDASLLHLSQIWSRGGANNNNATNSGGGIEQCLPFQGILGIQQGANVAAMLPLLRSAQGVYNDNDTTQDEEENGEEKENNKCIFDGLQFVILVDGSDIMMCHNDDLQEKEVVEDGESEVNKENTDKAATNQQQQEDDDEEEDWYVGPNGIESLHVIAETNNTTSKRNSELLAKRYGPNATIQYYKPTNRNKKSPSSSSNKMPTTQQKPYNHNRLTSPSLHNILGKYLVHQKNTLHSNPQTRKLLQLQHQLCHVEQLASVLITEEVKKNPPKCLMAMIGPAAAEDKDEGGDGKKKNGVDEIDDSDNSKRNNENDDDETSNTSGAVKAVVGKTVGAWQGPGRVPGEQGGGAPCPETFLLRQDERQKKIIGGGVVASHDVILADEK